MIVDFDPVKDAVNRAKHGVSLAFGGAVFADADHLILSSLRPEDGEDRLKAIGLIEGRLWTVIYVERGPAIRLISVRRSNAGEERSYRNPG